MRRTIGPYLAGIGEAPAIAVHVQHAFFDLARARLEARLVHFLLGVVHQRGVRGSGGRGGCVRRPGQTHTAQGHQQIDPLHPPAFSHSAQQPGATARHRPFTALPGEAQGL